MLSLLSAWASLWLLINLSASHERTQGVISASQREQQAQDPSSGLMNCYCSAANWSCWCEQPNLIPTRWKSLWNNSITANVCEGVNSPLKTALPGRLLVFSQDLKTTGSGYCFLWEHADVPQAEKIKWRLCSQQNEVPNNASCVVMLARPQDIQPQDFLG